MTEAAPRPSRYQQVSPAAKRMLALGESGRFEFKQDAEAVTPGVLAALANWVALDDDRALAEVLVGVKEIADDATGLVSGRPCGLSKGLDRAVARIQDVASKTRPIPVDLHIVEEASRPRPRSCDSKSGRPWRRISMTKDGVRRARAARRVL